jgi:hypothetical protein
VSTAVSRSQRIHSCYPLVRSLAKRCCLACLVRPGCAISTLGCLAGSSLSSRKARVARRLRMVRSSKCATRNVDMARGGRRRRGICRPHIRLAWHHVWSRAGCWLLHLRSWHRSFRAFQESLPLRRNPLLQCLGDPKTNPPAFAAAQSAALPPICLYVVAQSVVEPVPWRPSPGAYDDPLQAHGRVIAQAATMWRIWNGRGRLRAWQQTFS